MTSSNLNPDSHGKTPLTTHDLEGLRHNWVTTHGELNALEQENILQGRIWAFQSHRKPAELLDDHFLRNLHQRMFSEVWSWAGTYRTRETSLGIDPQRIPVATRTAILNFAEQSSHSTSSNDLQTAIANLHHSLIVIHPFPNGNGRVCRLYIDLVARAFQLTAPTWGASKPHARQQYISALQAADNGDIRELLAFMWP